MRKHARSHSVVVESQSQNMFEWVLKKLNISKELESVPVVKTFDPPKELGEFEAAVIAQILTTHQPEMLPLLKTMKLYETDYNGHGMYFETTSDKYYSDELDTLSEGKYANIGIENFETPQLKYGGGAILYFKDHEICSLEVYGFGEPFPKLITEWVFPLDQSNPSP